MKKILVIAVSLILLLTFISCDEVTNIVDIYTTADSAAVTGDAVTEESGEQPDNSESELSATDTEKPTEVVTEDSSDVGGDVIISDDNSDDIVGNWIMSMDFESVVGTAPDNFSSDAVVSFGVEFKADGTTEMVVEVKSFMATFEQYWSDCETYFKADNYKMLIELMGVDSLEDLEDTMDGSIDKILETMEKEFMAMAARVLDDLGKVDGNGKIISKEEFVLTGNKLFIDDEIDADDLNGDGYYILDMEDDDTYVAYAYNGDDEYKAFTMKKVG